MSDSEWSAWRPVEGAPRFSPVVLAEQLDGGQAFRWNRQADQSWLGQWGREVIALRLNSGGVLEWSGPASNESSLAVRRYLACDDLTHDEACATLPTRSDAHLATCLAAYPGLRILRQPFAETLLAFLCSATKQIVQIKQMLALLAERFGTPLDCPICNHNGYKPEAALPTWEQLAEVSEADLRGCLLGFRARYIKGTAEFLSAHPGWLAETEQRSYTEAKTRLLTLPGVGEKIADCVLLFGAGRLEAFPVDVWMIKVMARRYELTDWKPAQVAHFGRVHYGPVAGLAQQYLFAWERAHGSR